MGREYIYYYALDRAHNTQRKTFISNVEKRSYVPERLNNLLTAAQLEKCRGEIQPCSVCLYKLARFVPEEMSYVWLQFHLKSSEWRARN